MYVVTVARREQDGVCVGLSVLVCALQDIRYSIFVCLMFVYHDVYIYVFFYSGIDCDLCTDTEHYYYYRTTSTTTLTLTHHSSPSSAPPTHRRQREERESREMMNRSVGQYWQCE